MKGAGSRRESVQDHAVFVAVGQDRALRQGRELRRIRREDDLRSGFRDGERLPVFRRMRSEDDTVRVKRRLARNGFIERRAEIKGVSPLRRDLERHHRVGRPGQQYPLKERD